MRADAEALASSSSLDKLRENVPASRCCSMNAEGSAAGAVTPNAQTRDWIVSLFFGISNARIVDTPRDCGKSGT